MECQFVFCCSVLLKIILFLVHFTFKYSNNFVTRPKGLLDPKVKDDKDNCLESLDVLWIHTSCTSESSYYCQRFHFGNLPNEFHHAVQFGLDCRIAQHGEIVNVFILVLFQMNFTMLNNLGWIAELHNMVKLSTFSFWYSSK